MSDSRRFSRSDENTSTELWLQSFISTVIFNAGRIVEDFVEMVKIVQRKCA